MARRLRRPGGRSTANWTHRAVLPLRLQIMTEGAAARPERSPFGPGRVIVLTVQAVGQRWPVLLALVVLPEWAVSQALALGWSAIFHRARAPGAASTGWVVLDAELSTMFVLM